MMNRMAFGMVIGGFIGVGISLSLMVLNPFSTSGLAGFEILIIASIFFGGIIGDITGKKTNIKPLE